MLDGNLGTGVGRSIRNRVPRRGQETGAIRGFTKGRTMRDEEIEDFIAWRERRALTPHDLSLEAYREEVACVVARSTVRAARDLMDSGASMEEIKIVLRGDQT